MSHTCQPWMALSFLSGCDVPLPSSSVTPLSSTLSSRESFRQAVPLSIYSRSQLCVWGRGTVLWKLQRVATWGRSRPPHGEDPSWGRPCTHAHRTCSFSDPCWLTFWKLQCEPSHEPAALLCETLMTRGSLSHVLLSENTPSGSCVCCSYITKTGFSILSRFCHPAVASWGGMVLLDVWRDVHLHGSQNTSLGLPAWVFPFLPLSVPCSFAWIRAWAPFLGSLASMVHHCSRGHVTRFISSVVPPSLSSWLPSNCLHACCSLDHDAWGLVRT